MQYNIHRLTIYFFLFAAPFVFSQAARAQNTAFTFQGKLTDAGNPANGQYDLQFRLYDAPAGGTLFGAATREDVPVTDGVFTVTLDYGADVFYSNSGRYLEVGVRPGASTGAFTAINPRQELTASPYSLQAVRASKAGDAENLGGQSPSAYLRSNTDQTFTGGNLIVSPSSVLDVRGTLLGSGANLTGLDAGNISGGTLADARLSANVARLNAYNVFTGGVQFNAPPLGSGEFLTNLSASNLTGTIPDARLSGNIPRLDGGNDFTGFSHFRRLSVGNPSFPVTRILTAAALLDFGSNRIFQQVLNINVPGARVGDAVFLGIPANVLPLNAFPAVPPDTPASIAVEPYIFQAYVSSADTVSVTFMYNLFPAGDGSGTGIRPPNCINGGADCINPPPGLFRVVVFSFAP